MKESNNNDGSIGFIKGNNMSLYGTNYVLDSQRMPTQLKGVMQYSIPAVDVVTKKRINDEKELLNDIKAGKTISLYDKNSHVVESCLFDEILKECYERGED